MGAQPAPKGKASAGWINRRQVKVRQQMEVMLEEEWRIKMCAESVNQRALERRDGFERRVIQVNPLLKSERDMNCCACRFARGVNTASRARLLMIHILKELPMSLEAMMEYPRFLLTTASSNWKTLNLEPCLC